MNQMVAGCRECLCTDDWLCANITVRREIDSLNERLTGDGQTIDGGDPAKGALKTKGAPFPLNVLFFSLSCFKYIQLMLYIDGKGSYAGILVITLPGRHGKHAFYSTLKYPRIQKYLKLYVVINLFLFCC